MKTILCALAALATLGMAASAQASSGLAGAYYNGNPYFDNPDNTAWAATQTPFATFTANNVCFPDCYGDSVDDSSSLSTFLNVGGGSASNLSADQVGVSSHVLTLNGDLNLASGGDYQLFIASDDGSWLQLDGSPVVDVDGLHPMTGGWSGVLSLTAGAHPIEITQWENGGGTGLEAYIYNDDTGAEDVLGGDYLSHGGGAPEPSTWALMIIGLGGVGGMQRRRKPLALA